MKKKNAIILLVVNAIYLAAVYYVFGTIHPFGFDARFLVVLLCAILNAFVFLGFSLDIYD